MPTKLLVLLRMLVLVLGSALLLAACGGEGNGYHDDEDAASGVRAGDGEDLTASMRLGDDDLRGYVEVMAKWKERERRGQPPITLLEAQGLRLEKWVRIHGAVVVMMMQESVPQMSAQFAEARAQLETQLEDTEARLEAARDPQEREMLQSQVSALRESLDGLAGSRERIQAQYGDVDAQVGKHNREVIQRWLPQIREVWEQ